MPWVPLVPSTKVRYTVSSVVLFAATVTFVDSTARLALDAVPVKLPINPLALTIPAPLSDAVMLPLKICEFSLSVPKREFPDAVILPVMSTENKVDDAWKGVVPPDFIVQNLDLAPLISLEAAFEPIIKVKAPAVSANDEVKGVRKSKKPALSLKSPKPTLPVPANIRVASDKLDSVF